MIETRLINILERNPAHVKFYKTTHIRESGTWRMILTHTCIITDDVKGLSLFYQTVLGINPVLYREDYSEFNTERGNLSICARI